MLTHRASGLLLHISSLPSEFGIGDFGPGAYRVIDFLHEAKQSFWQILPVNPTELVYGNSPYSSPSAFAGNFLFISPGILLKQGLLSKDALKIKFQFPDGQVLYQEVIAYKKKIFQEAFKRFKKTSEYGIFFNDNAIWLKDYALFQVIHEQQQKAWNQWPLELRDRDPKVLEEFERKYKKECEFEYFLQYLFFQQWSQLKNYAREKGIRFIGDVPIYVNFDSADVWSHPQYFKLNAKKKAFVVAGVPPDYFSKTGQRWGNPVYDWERLKASGYDWWIKRLEMNFKLFDVIRVDHFRGFVQYWEVPAKERTAVNGSWQTVPAYDFFNALKARFPQPPIIAEDLGIITDDVKEVMRHFNFPGMKVLLFAFGDDLKHNPYLPHNYPRECVVYSGTHDNNTVKGWFQRNASTKEKENLKAYLGRETSARTISWDFVEFAMKSVANTAIIPLQDFLGLDQKARMNKPATKKGNWQWRLLPHAVTAELISKIAALTKETQRIP